MRKWTNAGMMKGEGMHWAFGLEWASWLMELKGRAKIVLASYLLVICIRQVCFLIIHENLAVSATRSRFRL